MSKRHWNYRVIRFTDAIGETHCAIHEVHYENEKPIGYTENPAVVLWETEDVNTPLSILEKMTLALSQEVLTEKDFMIG